MAKWQPYQEDGRPNPFNENDDPAKFWKEDPGDIALPSPGLITDFVYYMRGTEAPTLFQIWSMLFAISTCVKREAWLRFGDDLLFTCFFTLLVGPAGIVKKSFSIAKVIRVIQGMRRYIKDSQLKEMKHISLVTGKATPEALLEALLPKMKRGPEFDLRAKDGSVLRDSRGKVIRYKKTSEAGIALSELAATVGKKDYSRGLIEDLLDLYDPKEVWPWRTVGRGVAILRKTHTTLIAATTPAGFRDSVPAVAHSDGFVSRCAVVFQNRTARRFRRPVAVTNGPSMEDLRRRLAWVVENAIGEFDLTPEADAYFEHWYDRFADRREANPHLAGSWSRMDILLMQVSLLLRCQRYDADPENRTIELCDIQDADKLLRKTHNEATPLLRNLANGSNPEAIARIEYFLRKQKKPNRVAVLKGAHVLAADLDAALDQLVQEDRVRIRFNGKDVNVPTKNGGETYEWVGDIWTEEEAPSPEAGGESET